MIKKKVREKQEFDIFELIQDSLGFNNPFLFKKYLIEVFNNFRNSENKENNLPKLVLNVPFFLSYYWKTQQKARQR